MCIEIKSFLFISITLFNKLILFNLIIQYLYSANNLVLNNIIIASELNLLQSLIIDKFIVISFKGADFLFIYKNFQIIVVGGIVYITQ